MLKLNFREWEFPSQTRNDFETVRQILLSTWLNTYSGIVPPEDLKTYLHLTCNDEKLREIFSDKDSMGIIAEAEGKPVGWLRTNINRIENKYFINQIYVLKEYQGKRIGKKLLGLAEEEAKNEGFDRIWLAVMTENISSVNWYKALGFVFEYETPFTMVNTTVNHLFGWKKIHLNIS